MEDNNDEPTSPKGRVPVQHMVSQHSQVGTELHWSECSCGWESPHSDDYDLVCRWADGHFETARDERDAALDERIEIRRAINADMSEQSLDELRVMRVIQSRMLGIGRKTYKPLDLSRDLRDWSGEAASELSDMLFYAACREIALSSAAKHPASATALLAGSAADDSFMSASSKPYAGHRDATLAVPEMLDDRGVPAADTLLPTRESVGVVPRGDTSRESALCEGMGRDGLDRSGSARSTHVAPFESAPSPTFSPARDSVEHQHRGESVVITRHEPALSPRNDFLDRVEVGLRGLRDAPAVAPPGILLEFDLGDIE